MVLERAACCLLVIQLSGIALAAGNIDMPNAQGETALHGAVDKRMRELARELIGKGANVNLRTRNGESALHLATLDPNPAMLELLLLDRGADANLKDRKGSLPLHAAAEGGYLELVRLLLPRTADPQSKNGDGHSAADYAGRRGFRDVERVLRSSPPGDSKNRQRIKAPRKDLQ